MLAVSNFHDVGDHHTADRDTGVFWVGFPTGGTLVVEVESIAADGITKTTKRVVLFFPPGAGGKLKARMYDSSLEDRLARWVPITLFDIYTKLIKRLAGGQEPTNNLGELQDSARGYQFVVLDRMNRPHLLGDADDDRTPLVGSHGFMPWKDLDFEIQNNMTLRLMVKFQTRTGLGNVTQSDLEKRT